MIQSYMCRSRERAAVNDNLFMRVRSTRFYESQSLVEDIEIEFYKYFHFETRTAEASLTFSLVESLDLRRFVGNRLNFSRESSTINIVTSSIVQKYNGLTHSNHLRRLFLAFHSSEIKLPKFTSSSDVVVCVSLNSYASQICNRPNHVGATCTPT